MSHKHRHDCCCNNSYDCCCNKRYDCCCRRPDYYCYPCENSNNCGGFGRGSGISGILLALLFLGIC